MNTTTSLFAVATISIAVLGCGCHSESRPRVEPAANTPSPGEGINWPRLPKFGGPWVLYELNARSVTPTAGGPRLPSISIHANGDIAGSGGVNHFRGKVAPELVDAGKLDFSALTVSRMAGSPEAMKLEDEFMSVLSQAVTFREGADGMTLYSKSKVIARFKRKAGGAILCYEASPPSTETGARPGLSTR